MDEAPVAKNNKGNAAEMCTNKGNQKRKSWWEGFGRDAKKEVSWIT